VLPVSPFDWCQRQFKPPAPPGHSVSPGETWHDSDHCSSELEGSQLDLQDRDFGALPVDNPPQGREGFYLRPAVQGEAGMVKTEG